MFQNKRRRYSHESRGHTVRRRPLPGIGAVQDPGRCQVDLLLDARTPRGRTRRPPMRVTRSACGATAARSMGQEDQARPGACGHRHVAPPRQPDHEGRGHGGLVFEGPVPAASGQAERRSGPRTSSAANSMATPPHTHIAADPAYVGGSAVHGRAYACPASSRTARSRATPSGRGATRISCWPRSPRCASRWAASRCSTPTGAASSPGNASNECSTCSASRVSCRIPAAPTTTRWSNPPTGSSRRNPYATTSTRAWNDCARTPTGTYGGTTTSGSTRPSDT